MTISFLQYITLLLVVPFLIFIHVWRCNRNVLVPNWPIIGMLPTILHNLSTNAHDYATLVLKHHGGTMWFKGPWHTNTNFIFTSDAMNVHHINNKNLENYGRGSDFHEIFEVFGSGLINSNSNDWKQKRIELHSLLKNKTSEISLQQNIQKKVVNCLLPYLDHHASKLGAEVDLQDIFERLTFDTTCNFLFGFDPNCLPYNFTNQLPEVPYLKAISVIEEVILYRHYIPRGLWKLQKWLQVGQEKKNRVALQNMHQFIDQCISYISKGGDQSEEVDECHNFGSTRMLCHSHRPLIKALMKEEPRNKKEEDKYLQDVALGLLMAGNGTVSACLSWLFWLVSTHPVVEAKILLEIKDNLTITTSSVEGIDKLVYLHGAICEALRLYPPVPFEHTCAIKSDILPSGDHVSPNTRLIYSLYAMGRMEQIWGEDCLEFKPERWISERGDILHVPSYKFIAFNTGPRSCLGKDISLLQMKVVASALLCRFEIRVAECHLVIPKVSMVLRMKHGLKVKVSERDVYEKVSTTNSYKPNDEQV